MFWLEACPNLIMLELTPKKGHPKKNGVTQYSLVKSSVNKVQLVQGNPTECR